MREKKTYLKLVLLLCLIGVVVSGKLLSIHNRFATGQASLTESCGIMGGTGCQDVAVSKYSAVLGVPVAAIAMGAYIAIFLLCFWAWRNDQGGSESLFTAFFLSTLSIVITVVMFAISNYVLHAFCQYCAVLWVVNLAIWPLLVKQAGLGWGNALYANLELLGGGTLNLRRERILSSLGIAAACLVITSVAGLVSKASDEGPARDSTLVADYAKAPMVMLPAEAFGGPTAKGRGADSGAAVMEIAEMADFQCPACKMAGQFMRSFVLKHKDKVRLTYHNFPLDGSCNPYVPNGGHRVACAAARGSLCAAAQGKFWEYHDQVFDRQEELSPGVIEEIAGKVGLDTTAWQACLKDSATETKLQKDMQLGEMIGLESTPTIVINGRKLIGARQPSDLEALLYSLEQEQKK